MSWKNIYEQHYKILLLIPLLILFGAMMQIGLQYLTTGDFVNRGITLKGGSTITIDYDGSISPEELRSFIKERFPRTDVLVRTISSAGKIISVAIDSDAQEEGEITLLLNAIEEKFALKQDSYSVEIIGSSLGKSFFKQTLMAVLIAFLLMGGVVLIYFKTLAPSLMVILAAFSDIVATLAIFNLTGIKLSSAGIAAFLMLIGYSVDSDILLSTRFLKRQDLSPMERIYSAIKTGLTMSATTISVVTITLFLVNNEVVKQIMIILLIGLLVDLVMTYIQNVGLLRIYFERKQR